MSIAEVRKSIDAINDEVESDLKLFKSRWEVTADRLETLPANISKINSLTAARRYVADTIFAGDVPRTFANTTHARERIGYEALAQGGGGGWGEGGGDGGTLTFFETMLNP